MKTWAAMKKYHMLILSFVSKIESAVFGRSSKKANPAITSTTIVIVPLRSPRPG